MLCMGDSDKGVPHSAIGIGVRRAPDRAVRTCLPALPTHPGAPNIRPLRVDMTEQLVLPTKPGALHIL